MKASALFLVLAGAFLSCLQPCVAGGPITTFSIVAYDPDTGDFGVAVQSKYFAVGDVVPFAKAGVGAIATQARGFPEHGPKGLTMLEAGMTAEQTLKALMDTDTIPEGRQVGIVDVHGNAATHTGEECLHWAGGKTGKNFTVQGNLLAGPEVVNAMAASFEAKEGDLATRMVYALAAGQAAGGDARGRQSAAVLVVREGAGYLGLSDRYIDLHVEDHATPIRELIRLLNIRHAQIAYTDASEILAGLEAEEGIPVGAEAIAEARGIAESGLGFYQNDDSLWWLASQLRYLDGDFEAAVDAGTKALLIAPSWPRLSEVTQVELGLPPYLVKALREDVGFAVLWDSLSATHEQ